MTIVTLPLPFREYLAGLPPKGHQMKRILLSLALMITLGNARGQSNFPFDIELEPAIIDGFHGLHSYAWARSGDYILLVGGRTDGLHRRQPFAAFNRRENNTDLIVIDPEREKVWKQSVNSLSPSLSAQLQSTNMQFSQNGNLLVLVGGYGYSEKDGDHVTYPYLTQIKVKELVEAIRNGNDPAPFIRQVMDERMAVTGGRLGRLGENYLLVGGHRFEGRYNPHGPDHGPGFRQAYTNQVRIFRLTESESRMRIVDYSTITDTQALHRRDANLLPQFDEYGKKKLTIFSGVFREGRNAPFTTLVDVTGNGVKEIAGFEQKYSHYHTASLPVFDGRGKTMYSIFFGGIASYFLDKEGNMVKDDNLPFIKTISVVERSRKGITEYALPYEMPGYFGVAGEFIPAGKELYLEDGILDAEKLGEGRRLVGIIVGGIDSRAPNVFWSNDPEGSRASPIIWKVYMSGKK